MDQKPKLLDQVRDAIQTRHYSRRTEKTYVGWMALVNGGLPESSFPVACCAFAVWENNRTGRNIFDFLKKVQNRHMVYPSIESRSTFVSK